MGELPLPRKPRERIKRNPLILHLSRLKWEALNSQPDRYHGKSLKMNSTTNPESGAETAAVILHNVNKIYRLDSVDVPALTDVNLLVRPNRFTVLSGASGSGKTTLLNIMGCIDNANTGHILVAGEEVQQLSDDALSDFRAKNIGFIFQNFNLLPVLTAFENIEYPMIMAKVPPAKRKRRVEKLLNAVGLSDRAKNRPGQLSGGQRQRVAVARALACKPQLVLADEPTANLDSQTGTAIIQLMRHMQRAYHISFIFSSHDPKVLAAADDTLFIQDGRITSVKRCDDLAETSV
jgi:putative ABC transport system ATP-binding protein